MKRRSILTLIFFTSLLISGHDVFAARAKSKTLVQAERNSFDLYPEDFSEILKEALRHCSSGNFEDAADCFDDRIFSYRKEEANEKNLVRLELITADIEKEMRGYKMLRMEKSAKKFDFSNSENFAEAENYFTRLASISNRIRYLGQQIQAVGFTGYPYYLSRFILGINEEPDSGLAGTLELEFTKELEQLMDSAWKKCDVSCNAIKESLSEENIFTNEETLSNGKKELENLSIHADELTKIYGLNSRLKGKHSKNQKQNADFKASMSAVKNLSQEGEKFFGILSSLQEELKKNHEEPENKIESIRSDKDSYANELVASASNLSAWGKTVAALSKSHSLSTLSSIQDERLSWQVLASAYRQASFRTESKCTQSAVAMWVTVANYYSGTGILLHEEDSASLKKIKSYMQGIDGIFYPSRCVKNLEVLKSNIMKDRNALEECKVKLNNGYIYRSNFIKQQEIISETYEKISALEKDFFAIESSAGEKLLKAQLARNEIEIYCNRAKNFNEKNNFQQAFTSLQSANGACVRLTEDLKNDGDIQDEVFAKVAGIRKEIIEKQQPVLNAELRSIKNQAKAAYYSGDFEKAVGFLSLADSKREMWSKLLDITLEQDTELDRIKNFVNTARTIKEGREIQPYDAKSPEMRQNLSLAGKFFECGSELLRVGKQEEAEKFFSLATEKINQVKIYYPRNKVASILSMKIIKILNEKNFDEIFRAKVNELSKVNYSARNSLAQESYSSLLDLYEMNINYPGLKPLIENAEYAMGLKQKPADKNEIAKSSKLAKEAQELLAKAGRDAILLQQAKEKAQSAIDINPENGAAITVLDEIALRTGQQAAVVLSAKEEELYQKALSDLQKNKIFDANAKLSELMKSSSSSHSAKILKLKKRIEAKL